jgi:hypothetical protein
LDSRTRQPADALIIVDVKILEHRLNANILRSSCPYQLVAKPVLTVLLTKKLASMVALLACRSGVRTFAAACGWRTSLACFGVTLAAVPGCNGDAGASPDCFPGCVSSLVVSISGCH